MSNQVRSIARQAGAGKKYDKSPVNIRELAAEERKERAERAGNRLRALLEEESCEMRVQLLIGKQPVPLEQIVALPAVIQLVPK